MTKRELDRLVTLAATLYPDMWRQNPTEAFDRVKDDLRKIREHEQTEAELDALQQTLENAEPARPHPNVPFEEAIKEITDEKNLVRAMKKFRDFVGSLTKTEQERDSEIAAYREHGFEGKHMMELSDDFRHWYVLYKSEQARKSRAARSTKTKRRLRKN